MLHHKLGGKKLIRLLTKKSQVTGQKIYKIIQSFLKNTADFINATLDIGYTYLFNFMECFIRMFGFDIYVGVYHRLWFNRKSLICDLMEPFRCIIDKTVRNAINKKQISEKDYEIQKGEYRLKRDNNIKYSRLFFDALIPYKTDFFRYVQQYYRCFMGNKSVDCYPKFEI